MDSDSKQQIQSELSRGEKLLWSGRPGQGIRLHGADAFMIPFSLLWCGFAIFWEFSVLRTGAGPFFAIWGVPFVLIGLYMVVGRFFYDSYQRSRTWYGLTDQRIIIRGPGGTKSLALSGLTDITLTESGDRTGTIALGRSVVPFGGIAIPGWPGMGRFQPPTFEMIDDARVVHDQIRGAQRALTAGAGPVVS